MTTLRAAPTRHCHTEQFSGILTDHYLPSPYPKREEGMGKPKHKLARKQQAIGHFGKYHNTLSLSPQILHKNCFQFLLGITMVP